MGTPFNRNATNGILAASLIALPFSLLAQTTEIALETDWRRANEAVGTFQRGHADVVKWERTNLPETSSESSTSGTPIPSAEAAVRIIWQAHPDLAVPLAQLGAPNVNRIAEGKWNELDQSLQRRVEGAGEVLEIATRGRNAWMEAVAAQQTLKHRRDMAAATAAAKDLGQRMVAIGNWSKVQLAPVELTAANARMDLRRAQYAVDRAQSNLIKTLGLTGLVAKLSLPQELPAIPSQPMSEIELQHRADAIGAQLPMAERMRNRALFGDALKAYQSAHALALESTEVVLKTREFVTEETLLHYNGMLKSVWELLDEVRNQSQATLDVINAQRDFWTAETDLQWVLQGGEPSSLVSLNGTGGDAPAATTH